ncbi:MAG: GspE/PulE/PilB domain-containing protein [Planctomycetota bacterium]
MQLGEILVEQGLLTLEQVDEVLETQCRTGGAFGQIVERLFGLSMEDVEDAWAFQYEIRTSTLLTGELLPEPSVMEVIDSRQAWQFRVLPLRREHTELVLVTTREHLTRAMRFALRHISEPCFFVLTNADDLGDAIEEHFPMSGMTPQFIQGRGFNWSLLDEAA